MNVSVVWIDGEQARLFHFSEEAMKREQLRCRQPGRAASALGLGSGSGEFHDEVAAKIRSAERILLLGPGLAKFRFRTHLTEKAPEIAKHVVGCETVDHPTDAQIAALAMQYLRLPA